MLLTELLIFIKPTNRIPNPIQIVPAFFDVLVLTNMIKIMPMIRAIGARLSDLKKYMILDDPASKSINLMIWAVSWAFGAGFSIGDLAEFTLWSGQGTGLPALPIFGLFPQTVETNWVRIALMCVPVAAAFVMGMVVMLFNKGFHIRIGGSEQDIDVRHVVMSFAYPIAAFSIASAVVSVISSLLFSLSNGGLGTKHLAHVGVDVIASTRKVGQPTAVGLFSAWLLTLVAVSIFFAVRWMIRRIREQGRGDVVSASTKTSREETRASRTVSSKNNNKEDQGDNNESTDTKGSGVSLP